VARPQSLTGLGRKNYAAFDHDTRCRRQLRLQIGDGDIQLEDLADSARPFEAVRIQGRYHAGADTFLRVQRWEAGKWLAFPVPTKTDQSGQFTTHVEFGQPGRYQLRVLDPNSGVKSKSFVLVIKG
jgi:hypothetical protein